MLVSGPRERFVGSLVQIKDDGDPLRSEKTLLVASLLTLGIPRTTREFFHTTTERKNGALVRRTIWSLKSESVDGRFDAAKMIAAWDKGAWLLQNPTHPLAILRGGLTYARAFSYSPKFSLADLAGLETPDTWIEAGIRNLVFLLRSMPEAAQASRALVRFGPEWLAMVPKCLPQDRQTRLLKYAENRDKPDKRQQIAAS